MATIVININNFSVNVVFDVWKKEDQVARNVYFVVMSSLAYIHIMGMCGQGTVMNIQMLGTLASTSVSVLTSVTITCTTSR